MTAKSVLDFGGNQGIFVTLSNTRYFHKIYYCVGRVFTEGHLTRVGGRQSSRGPLCALYYDQLAIAHYVIPRARLDLPISLELLVLSF